MKQKMKKLMAVLLVMTLAIGVAQTTQRTTAQAAKKLTKADFKFTGTAKKTMNMLMYDKEYKKSGCDYVGWDIREEKTPEKCVKTKRGITLLSTEKQVIKKYGKDDLSKFEAVLPFAVYLKEKDKACWKFINNKNYVTYDYCTKDGNEYNLWFFFDNKDKVIAIYATKNAGFMD